jgi:mRNA interferase HigB
MKSLEEMLVVNKTQAEFYDGVHIAENAVSGMGHAQNKKANLTTRLWAKLRNCQHLSTRKVGIEERVLSAERAWSETKRGGRVLEIGCFSGSRLTFSLAHMSGSYTGVELSAKAVESLNEKFIRLGIRSKAKAIALDFLMLDESSKYDLIYAAAIWANPAQLKAQYGNASILKGSRAVFNICGNKYRVVVKINYSYSVVYVRFAGSHQEYDQIEVEEI